MPKRIDILTGAWVGRGEDAAFEIFRKWWPGIEIKRWVPFSTFNVFPPWGMSQRQFKETIDLVFVKNVWTVCVRIQDKSHKGRLKAACDAIQKSFLESRPFTKVIDIHEDDAQELFKDEVNEESELEIWLHFLDQAMVICPSCFEIGRWDRIDEKLFCDACGEAFTVNFTAQVK